MATSGTYSFSVTRDDVIRQSMLNIRRLDPDESPTPAETGDCARTLNMLVKQWMGKSDFAPGLKVWTRKRGYLLLSNSTSQYTLSASATGWANAMSATTTTSNAPIGVGAIPVASTTGATIGQTIAIQTTSGFAFAVISGISGNNLSFTPVLSVAVANAAAVFVYSAAAQAPLAVESALLRDVNNSDIPLKMLTSQDWDFLPSKMDPTNAGDPSAILYEAGINTGTLSTDVGSSQDTSKRIVLTYFEPVQDFNNPLDAPEYPQEWYLALCWGLSEQICPMFGAEWTQNQEKIKNAAIAIARNKGSEISTLFFQPGVED